MFLVALILALQGTVEIPNTVVRKSYAAHLEAAVERMEKSDLAAARAELDATELTDRGFEWQHLNLAVELARSADAGPGLLSRGRGIAVVTAPRVRAVSRMYGSSATLRTVAVSPRGDRVAAGGAEPQIHVWNARTGDPERLLAGHTGPIVGLVFSKDGRRLVSGSADGSAILWDTADGRRALTLRANGEPLSAIALSASGEWVATADSTLGMRVWSTAGNTARFVARGHAKPITAVAFSPDDRYVASCAEDGSVRVVALEGGDTVRVFTGDGTACHALVFEPDGVKLRVAIADGSLRRLDVATGERNETTAPTGDAFLGCVQSADTRRFVTCSEKGVVRFFDASSQPVFSTTLSSAPVIALAFDTHSSRLFACGEDHVVHVLETDAERAKALQRLDPGELPTDEAAAEMKPLALDTLCRRVVERPGLAEEAYARAETLSLAAAARAPSLGQIQSTIGGAIYRQGRYEEALTTLTAAGEARRGWPPNLAFRAMTLVRLERVEEARTVLERLEVLMREKRWENDVEARALLEETRAVVASAKPAPK